MSEKMIVACPQCQTRFVAPLEKFLPNGRKVRCAKCAHSWFQGPETAGAVKEAVAAPTETVPSPEAAGAEKAASAEPARSGESLMDRAARKTEDVPVSELAATQPVDPDSVSVGVSSSTSAGIGAAAAATAATAAAYSSTEKKATERPATTDRSGTGSYTPPAPGDDDLYQEKARGGGGFVRSLLYVVAAAVIVGGLGYAFKDAIAAKVPALDPPLTQWKNTVDGALSAVIPTSNPFRIEDVKYDINEDAGEIALLLTATVLNTDDKAQDAPKLAVSIIGPDDTVLETKTLSPEDMSATIAPGAGAPYYMRMPFPPENLERVEVDFAE